MTKHATAPAVNVGEVRTVDERVVRQKFGRLNDRRAFFADIEGSWTDRPRYRMIPQNLEMNTRDQVVSFLPGFLRLATRSPRGRRGRRSGRRAGAGAGDPALAPHRDPYR